MLSSAASPPFWAPGAATILHILAPSPSLPRPRLAGSGHTPFPSRDGARRRWQSCFPSRTGANRAGAADNTLMCQSVVAAKSPPHPPRRPRDSRHRRGPVPADQRKRGLLNCTSRALPTLRLVHSRTSWSGPRLSSPGLGKLHSNWQKRGLRGVEYLARKAFSSCMFLFLVAR